MAPSPWRSWFAGIGQRYAEERDRLKRQAEDAVKAEDAQHRQLRHDYRAKLNNVALKTEEARQIMDAIDVQVDYLRAVCGRQDDAKREGDDPGGGVHGGNPGDV